MPYQELMFTQKTDAKTYTMQPQQTLDIQRLIQNKPYWEKIASSSKHEKKTLILSDLVRQNRPDKDMTFEVKCVLHELLNEGFSIYVWQGHHLERLWDSEVFDHEMINKITPADPLHITQIAVLQLQLSADKLHLLKADLTRFILPSSITSSVKTWPKLTSHNSLSVRTLSELNPSNNIQYLEIHFLVEDLDIATLFTAYPNLLSLILTGSKYAQKQPILNSTQPLHNTLKRLTLRNLQLSNACFSNLSSSGMLNYLELDDITFTDPTPYLPQSFHALRTLKANKCLSATLLNAILNQANNLIHLELNNTEQTLSPNALRTMTNIRTLIIKKMSAKSLLQILHHGNKLISIKLNNIEYDQDEPIECVSLNALKQLSIEVSTLSWFTASRFNAPLLHTLTLDKCDTLPQTAPIFPKLRNLNLRHMRTNAHVVHGILRHTLLVEYISLHALKVSGRIDTLPQLLFVNSLEITTESNLSNQSMKALINAVPNVKNLTLSDIDYPGTDFTQHLNLPHLSSLDLEDTTIETYEFIELLQKLQVSCKNLQTIACETHTHQAYPELITLLDGHFKSIADEITLDELEDEEDEDDELEEQDNNDDNQSTNDPIQADMAPETGASSMFMDANTEYNSNQAQTVTQLFYATQGSNHPNVAHYRQNIFDVLTLVKKPHSINDAFLLERSSHHDDVTLITLASSSHDVFQLAPQYEQPSFYGKQSFDLDHQWQAILSLTPSDVLLCYHVDQAIAVEIGYSRCDNLYYIRTKTPNSHSNLTLDFLITHAPQPQIPNPIQEAINHFRDYGADTLKLGPQIFSGQALLFAINMQRTGSCRHRAVAFKNLMDQRNIQSRIVMNACHAFVEVYIDQNWLTCDLSGYAVDLTIDESYKPERHITPEELDFRRHLTTWNIPEASPNDIQCLLNNTHKSRLIHVDSSALAQLRLAIQAEANQTHHPVFYVHKPEDLICTAPHLKRTPSNQGIWQQGGGALHDFIKTAAHTPSLAPILLINYAYFEAEDIVRFNGLLDKHAHADGMILRADTQVIGLIDPNKSGAYQGADFYSRFSYIDKAPLVENATSSLKLPSMPGNAPADCCVINLCHASGWLTQLMGGWIIQGGEPYFEQGELTRALQSTQTIELLNPPHDEDFDCFWQQAQLNQAIVYQGESTSLRNINIYVSHAYNRNPVPIIHVPVSAQANVINPGVLSTFISQYTFVNNQLTKSPGIIEKLAKTGTQTIELLITRDLTQDAWELLHCEAHKHQVSFVVGRPLLVNTPSSSVQCIHTSDQDYTLARLTAQPHHWLIIDCSECTATDLLESIDGRWVGEVPNIHFEFKQQKHALITALNAGKNVILTGDFSEELRDELAPFLIQRIVEKHANGQVLIITEQPFDYLPNLVKKPTAQDKYKLIQTHFYATPDNLNRLIQETPDCFHTQSFVQLQTRLRYLNMNLYTPSSQAVHQGFETVNLTKPSLMPINLQTVKQNASLFHEQRYFALNTAFITSPYVYIAGLTGVGKSFFVEHILAQKPGYKLYVGADTPNLQAWASQHNTADYHVLFLDEANLSQREWSEFEGLFHNPPSILIAGTYYPLTYKHRVIFAGNPLSYGDERQIATLFQRHAAALIFEPLSLAVIFESFINPILGQLRIVSSNIKHQVASRVLEAYQFFVQHAEDEILISPRQIQMILHLIVKFMQQHLLRSSEADILCMTDFYIRQVTEPFVPKAQKQWFDQAFPVVTRPLFNTIKLPTQGPTGHYHMPSRAEASHLILEQLNLRPVGLNRLIIEGEPGIGKSEWCLDLLRLFKLPYYHLHVSMNPNERKKLLLKAFDEGRIVVIDEINCISQMEQLMNSLLDGKHPDEQHRKPHRSGFYIIGTQNSAHLAGRAIASQALQNRSTTLKLKPYNTEEMIKILLHMGLPETVSEQLVYAFEHNIEEAKPHGFTPAPTFRNLLNLASSLNIAARTTTTSAYRLFTEKSVGTSTQTSSRNIESLGF